MKIGKIAVLLLCIFSILNPGSALAYSYGDPNKEDIAETFKEIAAQLNQSPPNWEIATKAYEVRKQEIAQHFSAEVAQTLDANFQAKDKDLVKANYKALLVLNLKRRFDNAEQDLKNYPQAKALLAKAKGTYETLKPFIANVAPDVESKVSAAFDKTLESLGNPGLFGVGQKPVKPEEFKQQTEYILNTLTPLFPFQGKQAAPETGNGAVPGTVNQPSQVNPVLSAFLIGGVIVIGALLFWYSRKKRQSS